MNLNLEFPKGSIVKIVEGNTEISVPEYFVVHNMKAKSNEYIILAAGRKSETSDLDLILSDGSVYNISKMYLPIGDIILKRDGKGVIFCNSKTNEIRISDINDLLKQASLRL